MTRDDIIRMAREVGVDITGTEYWPFFIEELEAFAQLVAAAERKKTLEEMIYLHPTTAIKQAVEYEREACAKLCDELHTDSDAEFYGWEFADAIRSRGQA